jgi:sulfide:quinone oxidoreductase
VANGQTVPYDYLVITTGPKLSFEEVPGAGPIDGHTHSVCTVDHALGFWADYEEFLENPGPMVIGAMPGPAALARRMSLPSSWTPTCASASCATRCPSPLSPASPTSATSAWAAWATARACSRAKCAATTSSGSPTPAPPSVEDGKMLVDQLDEQGNLIKQHELPFKLS